MMLLLFCCSASANEKLKLLLSFAVGGLLGDVFLHLLPEAWAHVDKCTYTVSLTCHSGGARILREWVCFKGTSVTQ